MQKYEKNPISSYMQAKIQRMGTEIYKNMINFACFIKGVFE